MRQVSTDADLLQAVDLQGHEGHVVLCQLSRLQVQDYSMYLVFTWTVSALKLFFYPIVLEYKIKREIFGLLGYLLKVVDIFDI